MSGEPNLNDDAEAMPREKMLEYAKRKAKDILTDSGYAATLAKHEVEFNADWVDKGLAIGQHLFNCPECASRVSRHLAEQEGTGVDLS